jgi:hypothetical protein
LPEQHHVTGTAKGEPLAAGQTGARVRIPLDTPPSPRWSNALASALMTRLAGHPAVGHLHLDNVVQGAEIVLDGVEPREAELLGPVLLEAIEAANRVCPDATEQTGPPNMDQAEAEKVARAVETRSRR